jgi:hypothetical protein
MQSLSFGLVGAGFLIVALLIGFAIFASPLIAAIIFVIAFGGFLLRRGFRRAESESRDRRPAGTPTTEQASADVVEDSGPAIAAGRPRR